MRDLRIHGLLHNERMRVTARISTGAIVSGLVEKDPGDGVFRWEVEATPASGHGVLLLASGATPDYLGAVGALGNALAKL